MGGRALTPEDVAAVLDRFPLERAAGRTVDEAASTHTDLLIARIAALTDALRGADPGQTTHLATRLLLSDLSAVAAQFRGRTNAIRAPLTKALAALHGARTAS